MSTLHYHVNHNIPSYLPEADGYATKDWSDALSALLDEIKSYQDDWSGRCAEAHESEVQAEDCMNGGEARCDWQELWETAEAGRVGLKEGNLAEGEEAGFIYTPPEGAEVSIWLQACSEAGCVMTEDEN